MSTERALRVSQMIKRELADMLRRDLKDPRLSGLISFTDVETTSDLRNVKVFVSVFGTSKSSQQAEAEENSFAASGMEREKSRERESEKGRGRDSKSKHNASDEPMTPQEKATRGVLACLNEESGYIRGELCRRLKLRFAPELLFLPDVSLERGAKVSEILAKISRGEV